MKSPLCQRFGAVSPSPAVAELPGDAWTSFSTSSVQNVDGPVGGGSRATAACAPTAERAHLHLFVCTHRRSGIKSHGNGVWCIVSDMSQKLFDGLTSNPCCPEDGCLKILRLLHNKMIICS